MLKTIYMREIPVLEKYIDRVRYMHKCDGTITHDEEMELHFFDEMKAKIQQQLLELKSEREFVEWCKTEEIRAVKREVSSWLANARRTDQPEELVNCYSQIDFLLTKSIHFYSED